MPKFSSFAWRSWLIVLLLLGVGTPQAFGQGFGIELHNNAMPASAGMAGVSLTRPQDNLSAINGNPSTMTQYQGTVFTFGGAFIEPTVNVTQSAPLPLVGVDPYSAKSDTPSSLLGNIGVTHQTEVMNFPVTLGMGFVANAGLGVDFRPEAASNGTHASYLALDVVNSVALQLTPHLSVGSSVALGTSILDGPFVDSSSSQSDYAPRFTLGANYDFGNGVSAGGYWQSEKQFDFANVARFPDGSFQDISLDHPQNIGLGVANRCLMNGRLLLATDVVYKNWDNADFFRAIYEDQWAFLFGGQYQLTQRTKLRFGYGYNEDQTRDQVPGSIGGVIPIGGIPAVQYVQGQFAIINQHRLTGGFGIQDILPGVDFDASLAGAFPAEKSFGATTSSVESWYLAFGFTWRRGARRSECSSCLTSSAAPVTTMSPEAPYVPQ